MYSTMYNMYQWGSVDSVQQNHRTPTPNLVDLALTGCYVWFFIYFFETAGKHWRKAASWYSNSLALSQQWGGYVPTLYFTPPWQKWILSFHTLTGIALYPRCTSFSRKWYKRNILCIILQSILHFVVVYSFIPLLWQTLISLPVFQNVQGWNIGKNIYHTFNMGLSNTV